MDCKTSSDLMMSYIEKDIDFLQQANLLEHIAICDACRREYELISELNEMFCDLELFEPSEEFESRVMDLIDNSLYEEKANKRPTLQAILISIAIYLSVLIGFNTGKEAFFMEWRVIPSMVQQIAWISNIAEKLLVRIMLMFLYAKQIFNLLFKMIFQISLGSILIYGLGLVILTSLLVIINSTLYRILKNE